MIKFEVKNRFTMAVQFTAEIDCEEGAYSWVKMGLAVKWAISNKAVLTGAVLTGADLRGADLRGADLRIADLRGADLRSADLTGADLTGAVLRSADLTGAVLRSANGVDEKVKSLFVSAMCVATGYSWFAFEMEGGGVKIIAGCRYKTVAEFKAHLKTYTNEERKSAVSGMIGFVVSEAKRLNISLTPPKK